VLDCIQTLMRLHRYLDRDLTDDEVDDVKRHLEDCPPCHHHVRFEESVRRLVRIKCTGEGAPGHLRALIANQIRQAHERIQRL
jgi:mycothiol system anti-sigma-R factor